MSATQNDELLSILLVSLRNAAATFGEGSPPYESIRKTIEEHVQNMKASGQTTNVTQIRYDNSPAALARLLDELTLSPKPQ